MKLLFSFLASILISGSLALIPYKSSENEKVKALKIFVLNDSSKNKYYVSDNVKIFYKKGFIKETPLISIDGIVLEYDKNLDTVPLPLKRSEIKLVSCVNKNSSQIIFGTHGMDGAIVINTIASKYIRDTIKAEINRRK